MHDVTAGRIVGRRREPVRMRDPEGIARNVRPAVVVRIGKTDVAGQSQGEVQVSVLAGDATVAVVADEQVLHDQLQFAIDPVHLPDLLAVLGDVDLLVVGTVADLVHHCGEGALADFLDQLAVLVEHLDVRGLGPLHEQRAGNGYPHVAISIDRGGGGRVQSGREDTHLVAVGNQDLRRIGLHRNAFLPIACATRSLLIREHGVRHQRQCRRDCGGGQRSRKFHHLLLLIGRSDLRTWETDKARSPTASRRRTALAHWFSFVVRPVRIGAGESAERQGLL